MTEYVHPDDQPKIQVDNPPPGILDESVSYPEPTRPLTEKPGAVPDERTLGREIGDGPEFAQYLIAVGATGAPDKEILTKAFHDTGMAFAHQVGVEPILAVGYRSETAHPADYLDAAKVWHTHMSDRDHQSLMRALPKFYAALSILFGMPNRIG